MLRTSTRSKTLRMPSLEKMGLEGDLGALNVINLNADFGELKCDDKWYNHEDPKSDRYTAYEMKIMHDKC